MKYEVDIRRESQMSISDIDRIDGKGRANRDEMIVLDKREVTEK